MNNPRYFIGAVTMLISVGLFGIAVGQVQERRVFDWGAPRFIPVEVTVAKDKVVLKAGGERIEFMGRLFELDADTRMTADWSKHAGEFTTLSLTVQPEEEALLRNVTWFAGRWEKQAEKIVHATKVMDNMLFLRKNGISFFLSLDFPYSKIDDAGIHYPPNIPLKKDDRYEAHSLTIGACKLSGEKVGKFDRAEIEAASSYVEKRFPSQFPRPIVLSSSITNQMTDVRDNRVFYSLYDNPTVALNPELVEEDLKLNAELGIEYYQVFEGAFDWPDEEQTGKNMEHLQAMAKSLGVRMGDYTVPQGLYCGHYNYFQRKLDRPDWLIQKADGKKGPECLGVRDYIHMIKDRLVTHNRKYGLQLICLDFLDIEPCYATNHGHPVGDVYQQISGLVDLMSALNAVDENFLVWSNSGNWIELMPKLIWYNPNVYLTDPHVRQYAPHLNVLKNLGDGRREQMVNVHEQYFVPYTAFTNYEYYLAPNSRLADTKVFEYSFLQGLAVTPNLGLGEIRSFFDRIPSKDEERCKEFIKHWLNFIREHYDVWQYTSRLGDLPGVGAAEVYGHIKDGNGFLCFVNQNAFPVSKTLVMDGSIGLSQGTSFLLEEIYPNRGPITEQPLPAASLGDTIHFILDPYAVRIVEIAGYKPVSQPTVYGAEPIRIDKNGTEYRVTLRLPQGATKHLGIVLPGNEQVVGVEASQTPTVPMYTFPVTAELVSTRGNMARIRVQGPREEAPKALTNWRINQDSSWSVFPPSDLNGFLGAYVHNAFSEDYEVQLSIKTDGGQAVPEGKLPPVIVPQPLVPASSPTTGVVSYSTQFVLPFIERYGQDRSAADDAIVELGFSDPDAVTLKQVQLNGQQVPVLTFKNAKNPAHKTYYIELKGNVQPGLVQLQVWAEYKK
ncbi:hypothetical protein [Parapedobacter defluvii]|uniref:hypothetical protein n=1 Tax=Parapedobacter defluvii TaxID=2045106 RepID=UPI00334257A1